MILILREFFCLHRKFLLLNLVSRNIKLKYRKSYLGLFWTILAPAFSALIYFLVFKFVMKVQVPNYLSFVLSGILAWGFFSNALSSGLESIVGNYGLVSKVPIPLNVFALNEAISLFVNFILSQPILLILMALTGAPFTANLLYLPVLYFLLFIQAYSLSLVLSVLFVFFRDLRHLLSLALQMLFYMTPVVYSQHMIPEKFNSLMYWHPLFFIFEGIHSICSTGEKMDSVHLLTSFLWTLFIFLIAILVFEKKRNFLAEKI
ncbi:MAG: ABC transporter permease [Bdellovibrionaceae bacterium]|nr:ABC transporter permease [Pseudobdellovibrionaceae bacterium]